MKLLITFLTLTFGFITFSQDFFQWGTGAGRMGVNYQNIVADSESGVIALASQSKLSSWYYKSSFIQANGEKSRQQNLHQNQEGSLVLRLDSLGQLKWSKHISNNQAEILQLAVGPDDKIYLVINILTRDYNEEDIPYGYCSTFRRKVFNPGLYIFTLSPSGDLVSNVRIKGIIDPNSVNVTDFYLYEETQFIIGGFHEGSGKLINYIPTTTFDGGGNFVMKVDENGLVLWTDIVSHRSDECCGGPIINSQMDISPDGTIYLGGTYVGGGIFGNGTQTLAPKKYGDNDLGNLEVFVVAYSKDGKIKWIRTDQSISEFQRLKATNAGVFIAHYVHEGKSFGKKVNLSSTSNLLLTHINKRGKKKWDIISNMTHFKDMVITTNDHLILTGDYRIKHQDRDSTYYFGNFEITNRHNTFIAEIDSKSNILNYTSNYFGSSKEPAYLTINKNGAIFIAFEIFCGLPRNLKDMAKNLPDMECNGSVAVLGKIINFEK